MAGSEAIRFKINISALIGQFRQFREQYVIFQLFNFRLNDLDKYLHRSQTAIERQTTVEIEGNADGLCSMWLFEVLWFCGTNSRSQAANYL